MPLSPLGFRQAARLSRHFASRALQAVVSSHLRRSLDTARLIAQGNGHQLVPHVEPDLAEIHLGAWEGLTPEEVNAAYGDAYTRWRLVPSATRIPDAEPPEAFQQRVRRARDRLLATLVLRQAQDATASCALRQTQDPSTKGPERSRGTKDPERSRGTASRDDVKEAVIVTHGGVIAAILADALQADHDHLLRHLRLDNAGISVVEFEGGAGLSVVSINHTGHLEGLGDSSTEEPGVSP